MLFPMISINVQSTVWTRFPDDRRHKCLPDAYQMQRLSKDTILVSIENALVLDEIRRKYKARNEPVPCNKVRYESTVLPNHCPDGCLYKYCEEEARYGQESY